MSDGFQEYVERMQKADTDVEKIKKYILLLKRNFSTFIDEEEEYPVEEYIRDFIEEYREDLKTDPGSTRKRIYCLSQYNSYKELLNLAKGNQAKFRKLLETAIKLESTPVKEPLTISLNAEEQMLRSLRDVMRDNPKLRGKDLLVVLQKRKMYVADRLKSDLISSIQDNVGFLNGYGMLDEYIDMANDAIAKLGLDELALTRHWWPADEYGDGKGNTIRYDDKRKCFVKYDESGREIASGDELDEYYEDYGVLDMFDKDYLEKLSPEDLMMMDMFWRCKYLEERMQTSKAMYVIKDLNLWTHMFDSDEQWIDEIDDAAILESLGRYSIPRNEPEPEPQSTKRKLFVRKKKTEPEKPVEIKPSCVDVEEIEHLAVVTRDIIVQECTIISKLKAKDFSVRTWGTIESDEETKDMTIIAIDNENFRGTLLMSLPNEYLREFFGTDDLKLPKYKDKDKIDDLYSSIMQKLYLPASNYFKRMVKKKYSQNPSSPVLAGLAGKKVKSLPTQPNGEER